MPTIQLLACLALLLAHAFASSDGDEQQCDDDRYWNPGQRQCVRCPSKSATRQIYCSRRYTCCGDSERLVTPAPKWTTPVTQTPPHQSSTVGTLADLVQDNGALSKAVIAVIVIVGLAAIAAVIISLKYFASKFLFRDRSFKLAGASVVSNASTGPNAISSGENERPGIVTNMLVYNEDTRAADYADAPTGASNQEGEYEDPDA